MGVTPDEFIQLAKVETIKGTDVLNVYTVGPFGSRVSFAYQQRRALTLVHCLLSKNAIKQGDKVAVIGAGISGATTALALIKKGIVVDVFEENFKAIQLQAPSSHRYVHPSINFWPIEDVDPGTNFPFLNWHAKTADEIAIELRQEFEAEMDMGGLKGSFHTKITGVIALPKRTPEDRPKLKVSVRDVQTGDVIDQSEIYDAVILCTGFGVEKTVSGNTTDPYWKVDELHAKEGFSKTVKAVSGLGDGAIIDALRQVHTAFKKGELFYETIVEIESNVASHAVLARFKKFQENLKLNSTVRITTPEVANNISDACTELLDRLPQSLKSKLQASLKARKDMPAPNNCVELIGPSPGPFQPRIAPIHLLLLKHAIDQGVIRWVEGRLENGKIIATTGTTDAPINCIVRHGPNHSTDFFDQIDIESLKNKQAVLGNWVDFDFDLNYPLGPEEENRLNEKKRKLALRMANCHFPADEVVDVAIGATGLELIWNVIHKGQPKIPLPQKLFGRKLVPGNIRSYTAEGANP